MRELSLIDPVKEPSWDHFVINHPNGQIYHHSGWKTHLESSFKHIKGKYYVLNGGGGSDIFAGLPVFEVKSWLTGRRLVCSPYATHCDPLVTDPGQINIFLEELIRLSKELKCTYIELKTFKTDALINNQQFGASRYYRYHYLNLGLPLDKLWTGFHRSCVRQRIQRAERSDVQLKVGATESDLKDFYRLLAMTRERRALPLQPYSFFKSLWDVFSPSKQIQLLLAQKDGVSVSTLLLLLFKDTMTAEYAASDKNFKDMSPNHFLFWEAIRTAHEKGYKIFDFGRTSPQNTSLMDFKKRWGTQEVSLTHYYYPAERATAVSQKEEGWKYKIVKKVVSLDLPGPAQKFLGDFLYRHMG
jgi:serine/alanine adding enzyme